MATVQLKLGPTDHGRPLSFGEAESAEYVPGFKYEIIDGRLYVSPQPNLPEQRLERWLRLALEWYAQEHPEVMNFVAAKGRVFIPSAHRLTVPEPDLAAYANFPDDSALDAVSWEDVSPVLVCEILVEGSIEKDLGRNPALYLAVPSIREYWVLNGSVDPNQPSLIQYRRRGKSWSVSTFPYGTTFTTKLLPDLELLIDPRK